jgi:hypothetical protein
MKPAIITFAMSVLLCIGCATLAVRPDVDVEVVNSSSRDLSNAEVHFGEHICGWGSVIRGASKGYGFYPHPITADAVLRWWEEGRGQRSENLDLRTVYSRGAAGRLTFTISDSGVKASYRKE